MDNQTYKIDRRKQISILNHSKMGHAVFFILFCLPFLIIGTYGLIDFFLLKETDWQNIEKLIIPLLFFIVGSIAILFAISFFRKEFHKRKIEKKIIKNGQFVVATISNYLCQKIYRNSKNQSAYYKVSFFYHYFNLKNELIEKSFNESLEDMPDLFDGSKIMLRIYEEDIILLDKYTLLPDSQKRLDKQFNNESKNLFNGLTNRTVKINPKTV